MVSLGWGADMCRVCLTGVVACPLVPTWFNYIAKINRRGAHTATYQGRKLAKKRPPGPLLKPCGQGADFYKMLRCSQPGAFFLDHLFIQFLEEWRRRIERGAGLQEIG